MAESKEYFGEGTVRFCRPYPKQELFLTAKTRYIAYGGARGGGKSWAARTKAVLLALYYPGLQVLLLRRTLKELRENHVLFLIKQLKGVARYSENAKEFRFPNGSRLLLGYCDGERDVLQYQGQAYDVIFMEEATHFTEYQYQTLTESNRVSGMCKKPFPPRMYLTCNPGGVGHQWVKRLFIDRQYRGSEKADDYTMIHARVYDNKFLMKNDPDYVHKLENLPKDRRRAMLEGDWDIFSGQYFSEFRRELHVVRPFTLPAHWRRYVAMDYGLDMLACYWIALDDSENAYVYRELYESGLVVSDAAARILAAGEEEEIYAYYAPPDLWNRHSDSGKSTAELFAEQGLGVVKSQNDRVHGWLGVKEWMKPVQGEDGKMAPRLRIFENCPNLIRTLPALQFDEKNPNDCAREPHELTHAPDALRYFVAGRPFPAQRAVQKTDEEYVDYDTEVDAILQYGTR